MTVIAEDVAGSSLMPWWRMIDVLPEPVRVTGWHIVGVVGLIGRLAVWELEAPSPNQ